MPLLLLPLRKLLMMLPLRKLLMMLLLKRLLMMLLPPPLQPRKKPTLFSAPLPQRLSPFLLFHSDELSFSLVVRSFFFFSLKSAAPNLLLINCIRISSSKFSNKMYFPG